MQSRSYPPPLNNNSFVKSNPYLTVDTSLFPPAFQAELLSELSLADDPTLSKGLDAATDGLLIHADNFQALQLLQTRYREQVKCIYIDPPYNAKSSEIPYKNTFKHSAWLSLIESRIFLADKLLVNDFVFIISIDENEQEVLGIMLEQLFKHNHIELISIIHNHKGIQSKNFSNINEYSYFVFPSNNKQYISKKKRDGYSMANLNLRDKGSGSLRENARTCFYPFLIDKDKNIIGVGEVPHDNFHPIDQLENCGDIIKIWPIDKNGIERKWRYSRNSFDSIKDIIKAEPKGFNIDINIYKDEENYKTIWDDSKFNAGLHGTKVLNNIINGAPFNFPKSISLVSEFCRAGLNSHNRGIVLDYFAGSGTTAHAVINLNREDGGKPQADKDGDLHGVPQIVKVLQLESYEDTLNNLTLARQDDVFKRLSETVQEDYLLRYMLTHESRDSLLSTDDFKHPFAYRLNIATSSAGSYESRVIDLVETFNYLLGISVQAVDDQRHDPRRQFVFIEGRLPNGENSLIVWRDCERWDYQQLPELLKKRRINPNNHEFDVIYINGDHNIPTVLQEADGIKTLKLRPIEPEFLSLMFDVEDM